MRINDNATVADELAFEALPQDVKDLVQRLYNSPPGGYSEDDIAIAYETGWEDACESVSVPRWEGDMQADNYVKNHLKR